MLYPYNFSDLPSVGLLKALAQANTAVPAALLTQQNLVPMFGKSVTQNPTTKADTQTSVAFRGDLNTGYYGYVNVSYRRVNLDNLFRGTTSVNGKPVVTLVSWSSTNTLSFAQVISELNRRFGFGFSARDIGTANGGTPDTSQAMIQSGQTVVLPIAPDSAYFTSSGNVSITWTKPATQDFQEMVRPQGPNLSIRSYFGGNATSNRSNQAEYFFYGLDCSTIKAALVRLAATPNAAINWTQGDGATVLAFLSGQRPELGLNTGADTTAGGMTGLRAQTVTLAAKGTTGANFRKFPTAVLLSSPDTGTWFSGKFILHYT